MTDSTKTPRLRLSMADLPNDLLTAIGDVTVAWSYVQNLMEVAIWGMLGLTVKQGIALTAPFMFRGKMDMFSYVGKDYFKDKPEILVEYKNLASKIGTTYTRRNQIEHTTWQHFGSKDDPSVSARITRNAVIEPEFKSAKDVDALAQDIIKLVMELDGFMQKHIPTPKPSQSKSP